MIKLTETLWIGNSADAKNLAALGVSAVLNVAQDLAGSAPWPDYEYMQVGLADGPGNPLTAYCAAVLALSSLLRRHRTLVCCHTGSRSLAIAIMYLEATHSRGWDGWLELLAERVSIDLPAPHVAHAVAFDEINWVALSDLIRLGE